MSKSEDMLQNAAVRTWLAMLASSNAVKKKINAELARQFGLSISRYDILAALDRAGPEGLRAGSLSTALRVTDGNTTQLVTRLIRDGFVTRRPDPEDGRATRISLSPLGQDMFRRATQAHHAWIAEIFRDFPEADLSDLRALLRRVSTQTEKAKDL